MVVTQPPHNRRTVAGAAPRDAADASGTMVAAEVVPSREAPAVARPVDHVERSTKGTAVWGAGRTAAACALATGGVDYPAS